MIQSKSIADREGVAAALKHKVDDLIQVLETTKKLISLHLGGEPADVLHSEIPDFEVSRALDEQRSEKIAHMVRKAREEGQL